MTGRRAGFCQSVEYTGFQIVKGKHTILVCGQCDRLSAAYQLPAAPFILDLFQFEGCTLKKIGYAGDAAVKSEAEARGLAPEEVIVLTSTFETDGENHNNGLNPNYTYKDYTWTLTRHTSAGLWEVTDHGYG
jgi:hypothetical protein